MSAKRERDRAVQRAERAEQNKKSRDESATNSAAIISTKAAEKEEKEVQERMQSEKNSAAIISAKAAEGAEHEANSAAILSAKAAAVSCKNSFVFYSPLIIRLSFLQG